MVTRASDAPPEQAPQATAVAPAAPAEAEPNLHRGRWLSEILAHSPDVISILDPADHILYLSRTVPGVRTEDIVGRAAHSFLPPADQETWLAAFHRAIETGEPQSVEVLSRGSFWWETRLAPIRLGDEIRYVLSIGTDVTAKKLAQYELELKRHQLVLAVEASGMGMWHWSIVDDRVTWDAAAKRIFDWPPERDDISYASFLSRVHSDDRERVAQHVARAVETGTYAPLECRIVPPGGGQQWIHVTGKVVKDSEGRATDLVGGLVDTTRSREAEAQAERARRLEAVGQLAGGIAHDFNNLLVAIMGNVELARRADSEELRGKLLDDALAASTRAAELTQQLLAFSHRRPLVQASFDVNALLDDALRMLRRLIPESIRIEFRRSRQTAAVLGDRSQLEQVVINLAVNARDAMPAGGHLELATEIAVVEDLHDTHPWVQPGAYVLLTVRDTGTGIAPADLDRVFDPFFTTKEHGTGLGLATCYATVKRHGGMVLIESTEGRGTTVKVYLPLAERSGAEVATRPERRPSGGHERILVAEDDPGVRAVVVRILENAGYSVRTAADGVEAMAHFTAAPEAFDLVLVDAIMPHKGGTEVAAEIRALRPDMRIVLSSGYAETSLLSEDFHFLPKPYEPDTLLHVVRKALGAPRDPS